MKSVRIISQGFLASAMLVSASALADAWSCRHDNLLREVVVEYPQGGTLPCNVIYKKQTEGFGDQKLWSASSTEGYCEQKAADLVGKLESWGWTCAETLESQGGESM